MRFGVRSKAVEKLEDVKDELKNTSIQITCLDEDGNVLKRVTSGDSGDIEDNEGNESQSGGGNSSDNGGGTIRQPNPSGNGDTDE